MAIDVKHRAARAGMFDEWKEEHIGAEIAPWGHAVEITLYIPYAEGRKQVELTVNPEAFAALARAIMRSDPNTASAAFGKAIYDQYTGNLPA